MEFSVVDFQIQGIFVLTSNPGGEAKVEEVE